jgi:hypothetical protein
VDYDGEHVTFEYKDYKTGRQRRERCEAVRFVRLVLQHVLPRYAPNIRYYGLYRPQARRRWFAQARQASKYPQNIRGPPARHLTWRERILAAFKIDPIQCPRCGTPMVVHDVRWPIRRRMTKRARAMQMAFAFAPSDPCAPQATPPPARSASARRAA